MKTALILRLAALLALIQALAHGTMHVTYTPKHGPAEAAVVETMQTQHFRFGGFDRTYWDFHFGYGLQVAFGCLVQAALLWQLAALAKTESARLRPLLMVLVGANLGSAALVSRYFFPLPVVFYVAIAGCLGLAWATAGRTQSPSPSPLNPPVPHPAAR